MWIGFGFPSVLPDNRPAHAKAGQFASTGAASPTWLAQLDRSVGSVVQTSGIWTVLMMASLERMTGLSTLARGRARTVGIRVGIGLATLVWVVGQGMGELLSGRSTDVNDAPLVVPLAVGVLGTGKRIEPAPRARTAEADHCRRVTASAA
jgi:hypothetical protein